MSGKPSARAVLFHGPGVPWTFDTFDVPEPGPGEYLVRVSCCTVCGSDLHTAQGARATPTPTVLGHEILGEIVALGDSSPRVDAAGQPIQEGDRITWSVSASCHACDFCRDGLPQKCEHLFKYGHESIHRGNPLSGGLAEFILLRRGTTVVRLDPALTDAEACPASCATATVAAAIRLAGDVNGRAVLVLGAGALGRTACAMARSLGAATVIASDIDAVRLESARAFGATALVPGGSILDVAEGVRENTKGRGADVAIELSGATPALEAGLEALRIGGTLVAVGAVYPAPPIRLEPERLVRRMWNIRGLHNYGPQDLVAAVDFLTRFRDQYPFESLVTSQWRLDQTPEAFRAALKNPGGRVLIRP